MHFLLVKEVNVVEGVEQVMKKGIEVEVRVKEGDFEVGMIALEEDFEAYVM